MSPVLTQEYAKTFPNLVSAHNIVPLEGPRLALFNQPLANQLGVKAADINVLREWCLGNPPTSGHAQKYVGHQFGVFNPDLGDGRGVLLGEIEDEQAQIWDLHLKGAGPTAYSRGGDGRAVLRSSLREYFASETLNHWGIATTRALALVSSQQGVQRERLEPGAMLTRVAKTHVRFGHFEYCYSQRLVTEQKQLWQHVMQRCWPQLTDAEPIEQFRAVVKATAEMIADWQAFGFIHGVMNTDNMSICGDTFDFGPYTVFDTFIPQQIFNHTDHRGRYSFLRQPSVGLWNLQRLSQALSLIFPVDALAPVLNEYEDFLQQRYLGRMRKRLGLMHGDDSVAFKRVGEWMGLMQRFEWDFQDSFIMLQDIIKGDRAMPDDDLFKDWYECYMADNDQQPQLGVMETTNPRVSLRNHHLAQVIAQAEQGEWTAAQSYLGALTGQSLSADELSYWQQPPNSNEQVTSLSCSS
ncbi:protein adenylyltransferase SelO family protein [Idiomarina sp. UBA3162]|uniref:protein adenylyltransferase SelO family protein n=1 Tax=Idiomarina sp. UBA3162 TaxID=1946641 RepID=UPI000C8ECC7E|nr:YdiU family protein [Idiomarina sp. UBA3162]MAD54418.1 hypothetical protein [Idiomarinaceae bacterium]